MALLGCAGHNSRPMIHIYCLEKIGGKVAVKIADAYLDAVFGEELLGKLEECLG